MVRFIETYTLSRWRHDSDVEVFIRVCKNGSSGKRRRCGGYVRPLLRRSPTATVRFSWHRFAAERRPIEKALDLVGRVDAINRVEIRARVKGFLEEILFKEGASIKTGQPFYIIEKGLFAAEDVEQAEGAVERSEAAKALAEIQLNRAPSCWRNNPAPRSRATRRPRPIGRRRAS